ncbi:TonB-dependent receptor [Thalassotalea sp. 1_MG-2023]|uniref:TonB-dependent receptor n=1 Tax=Thalassotalea sp. 1_MG-2023 TaxID=3062680 RepID=UPI0026E24ED7|nr:TonB-dependent receptor [Thalassotalea sp. 1_MG-2023]MDO6425698.1 TonB-dependent receptor [Thalassotalea sp. 1_MG-2023]
MKKEFNKTFKRSVAAIAVSTVLGMGVASADDIIGKVTVQDSTDSYTVKAVNVATGTTRSASLNDDGSYRLPKLPSGNYKITVMRGNTVVAEDEARSVLGRNTVTNFEIASTSDTEVIQVVGSSVSTIDLASSDSGLVIGDVEINRMPIARNITSVALLAPGTVKGDSAFGNTASFGGSSVAENACYINGLEVTNTRQGLGCGEVPFEFYKEFQIKTGGYSAKYGRATGGTMNSITKGGSNEWEFAAVLHMEPDSLQEEGTYSRGKGGSGKIFRDERRDSNDRTDFTFSASGPIIEDTLFFYALVNPRNVESEYTWGGTEYGANDEFRTTKASGGDNMFWGGKIDWDINENHRLSLFGYSNRSDTERKVYDYDPNTGSNGTVGDFIDSAILKRGGEATSLSYTGYITDDLIVTALVGKIETEYETQSTNLECPSVTDSRNTNNPVKGCGAGGSFGANNDSNEQYRLDFEYTIGDHTIVAGWDYQERDSQRISRPIGGHSFDYKTLAPGGDFQADNGALENDTGSALDYVEDRIFDGGGSFNSELTAFYIEDKWQVNDNLVLDIGLRRDEFDSWGTTGKLLTSFKTDVAPRLGFTWDPQGDGESKLYGTYGRYFLPVANNTIFRAASGVSDITTAYTFSGIDASTGAPTGLTPLAESLGVGGLSDSQQVSGVPTIPEKDIFQAQEADPFSKDEYIIGYERILNEEYTVGVKGTYREVATALDDYCGRYAYPYCVMINPGSTSSWYADGYYWDGSGWGDSSFNNDGVPDEGSLQTYSPETIGLPKANNEYSALEGMVKYRQDNFRYTFTYTWSRSTGNFEGAVKSDIGQADAGITQDFDFAALMDGAQGYQPNDRRHVFKFFGSWEPMEDLMVGWNATLSSGRPVSLFGQGYPSDDPNVNGGWGDLFYLADTDENGELTGTYTRHARGTAGRTPWTFKVDLSAAYNFTVSDIDMKASINVFNLLNTQDALMFNEHYEQSEGVPNQWHGAAYNFQMPRYVRIGLEARF